jgi:hypothetical protein
MRMVRLVGRAFGWLRRNVEGFLALAIAVTFLVLGVLDVYGADSSVVNSAILLTLALLAATLLRDRETSKKALEAISSARLVSGSEVAQVRAEARRHTDRWVFKGGTGAALRAETLPEFAKMAREEQRTLDLKLEVIDPSNELLCEEYAQVLASQNPADSTPWTADRVRQEVYATLLAAFRENRQVKYLKVEVRLSQLVSTLRWELSDATVIMAEPSGPAMVFKKDSPYYATCKRELTVSFDQARPVPLDAAKDQPFSDPPSEEEIRELFRALTVELPSSQDSKTIAAIGKAAGIKIEEY